MFWQGSTLASLGHLLDAPVFLLIQMVLCRTGVGSLRWGWHFPLAGSALRVRGLLFEPEDDLGGGKPLNGQGRIALFGRREQFGRNGR